MIKDREFTFVKSYVEYGEENKTFVYSVSQVHEGKAVFSFANIERFSKWHMYTDFSIEIQHAVISFDGQEKELKIYTSEDGREHLLDVGPVSGNVKIEVSIKTLSCEESYKIIKKMYLNSLAHIEQLIISERELQSENNTYKNILNSRKWRFIRQIEKVYEKIVR